MVFCCRKGDPVKEAALEEEKVLMAEKFEEWRLDFPPKERLDLFHIQIH